jgi:hypothetical protein
MIDKRELPASWPAGIREATEAGRVMRASPPLLNLCEGVLIDEVLGWPGAIPQLPEFHNIEALHEIIGRFGWAASPLSWALAHAKRMGQKIAVAPHMRVISDAIVDAFTGRGPKVIAISLPARYGKSTVGGRNALGWFLANYPGYPAIYLTASADAAGSMGRLVRNDLSLAAETTGVQVAEDSSAASRFNTQIEGGQLISAGILEQVLGRGASLMVIDDVFRSSEDAASPASREKVWDLWQGTFSQRLSEGAVVVAIGTRWHSQDFLGRLVEGYGDCAPTPARVIRCAALAEKNDILGRNIGEPLSTGPVLIPGFGLSLAELLARKAGVSSDVWESSFQQKPVDETKVGKAYQFEDRLISETVYDPMAGPICASYDFNVDPMSIVLLQVKQSFAPLAHLLSPDRAIFREVYVLDELSLPDSNTEEATQALIEKLLDITGRAVPIKIRITGDCSGNQRRSSASRVDQTDWSIVRKLFGQQSRFQVRWDLRSSNGSVKARVNTVNSILARPVTKIDPKCRALIRDLQTQLWARDSFGNAVGTLDKRDPKIGHMGDAFGYAAEAWCGSELTMTVGERSAPLGVFLG